MQHELALAVIESKLNQISELVNKYQNPHIWKKVNEEGLIIYDIYGSNIGDAFYGGMGEGEKILAEQIKEILNQ